jgi:hypothetical protein
MCTQMACRFADIGHIVRGGHIVGVPWPEQAIAIPFSRDEKARIEQAAIRWGNDPINLGCTFGVVFNEEGVCLCSQFPDTTGAFMEAQVAAQTSLFSAMMHALMPLSRHAPSDRRLQIRIAQETAGMDLTRVLEVRWIRR